MLQSLHAGASALTAQQRNIDVIANNVANMDVDGYKKTRLDFEDLLYQTLRAPHPASNGPEKNLQRGSGVKDSQIIRLLTQGALRDTGRVLDIAFEGQGFLVVENPNYDEDLDVEYDPSLLYVRNGNLHLSNEEEGVYLVDNHGRYLLDEDGERIQLPADMDVSTLACSEDGWLSYVDANGLVMDIAQLQLADFTNPAGLQDVGNGAFMESDNIGERLTAAGKLVQGKLEGSNVDYAEEVTRLIRAQRAYQLASRAISTADQMMGIANNIRQ